MFGIEGVVQRLLQIPKVVGSLSPIELAVGCERFGFACPDVEGRQYNSICFGSGGESDTFGCVLVREDLTSGLILGLEKGNVCLKRIPLGNGLVEVNPQTSKDPVF